MVRSETTDQPSATPEWFARAATAVSNAVDKMPKGAIVIHKRDLPDLIREEDQGLSECTPLCIRGLPVALLNRAGVRTALYRENCEDVLVIYNPRRIQLKGARRVAPLKAYAPRVREALV